jgi:hypothetical protein
VGLLTLVAQATSGPQQSTVAAEMQAQLMVLSLQTTGHRLATVTRYKLGLLAQKTFPQSSLQLVLERHLAL